MFNRSHAKIVLLMIVLISIIGCQKIDDRNKRQGYVYESPEDAIKDAGTDKLIDAVESKGYIVYRHPKEALDDIDVETLLDELRYKKETYFRLNENGAAK